MQWWIYAIIIVATKGIINLANAWYLALQCSSYEKWVATSDTGWDKKLARSKDRTIRMMKAAGVKEKGLYLTQPTGYGNAVSGFIGMYAYYPSRIQEHVQGTYAGFHEAIGTYRGRALDAINPLYWISLIVYLPTKSFASLGANPDGAVLKVLQGLYWLAGVVFAALWVFFKPQALQEAISFLQNLAKRP